MPLITVHISYLLGKENQKKLLPISCYLRLSLYDLVIITLITS